MLDIDVIRADPEKIRDMLIKRNKTTERLDRLLEADGEWRKLTNENNQLRKTRNAVSLEIGKMPKGAEKDAKMPTSRKISQHNAASAMRPGIQP